MILSIIIAISSCLFALIIGIKNYRLKKENFNLELNYQGLQKQLEFCKENLNTRQETYMQNLKEQKLDYQERLKELQEQYQNNITLLKNELHHNLKEQEQALLIQNKNFIGNDSKKILEEIFTPLKEKIKAYETRLTQNEISLKTQIESIFATTQVMGKNAEKLTQILKGDKKFRGNFGEIQLKNILENSGLIEGQQYKLQETMRHDQTRYIPDAIIYLEREKSIVIDAKFSLPSHFDFETIDKNICLEISKNLRMRIDELSKKPYTSLDKNIYDFILLFIPYQNILDLALEVDSSIYQYAYNKKIYLTTPHTLFMALKTINITWLNIKSSENATKALEEVGKFYDKFSGIVANFQDIKTHLTRLEKATNELDNKLISGNGNLKSRFKGLEELGIKAKKLL